MRWIFPIFRWIMFALLALFGTLSLNLRPVQSFTVISVPSTSHSDIILSVAGVDSHASTATIEITFPIDRAHEHVDIGWKDVFSPKSIAKIRIGDDEAEVQGEAWSRARLGCNDTVATSETLMYSGEKMEKKDVGFNTSLSRTHPKRKRRSTDLCSETCRYSGDNECDDGGSGSDYSYCDLGTDCSDCGRRLIDGEASETSSTSTTAAPTTSDVSTVSEDVLFSGLSRQAITNTANSARSVYAADLDNDGDMDVLSASYNDYTIA